MECPFARAVWFVGMWNIIIHNPNVACLKEMLSWLLEIVQVFVDQHSELLVACILDTIWKARNKYVFKGVVPYPIEVSTVA